MKTMTSRDTLTIMHTLTLSLSFSNFLMLTHTSICSSHYTLFLDGGNTQQHYNHRATHHSTAKITLNVKIHDTEELSEHRYKENVNSNNDSITAWEAVKVTLKFQ